MQKLQGFSDQIICTRNIILKLCDVEQEQRNATKTNILSKVAKEITSFPSDEPRMAGPCPGYIPHLDGTCRLSVRQCGKSMSCNEKYKICPKKILVTYITHKMYRNKQVTRVVVQFLHKCSACLHFLASNW